MNLHAWTASTGGRNQSALRIAVIYAIIGSLWILFSDELATTITRDPAALTRLSMLKGWGYVLLTSLLVYYLIRHDISTVRDSEERFRSLFDNQHAVMLVIDPDGGQIVDANPAACAYYGYERATLQAMNIADLNRLPPEQVAREMQQARTGRRQQFHFQHRLADGRVRQVEVDSGPVALRPKPLLFSIVHDITDRQQAEQALRQSEERFRALFHASLVPTSLSDLHSGVFLDVNDAYTRLCGIPRESLLGRPARDLGLWAQPAQRQELLAELQDHGQVVGKEIHMRTASGQVRHLLAAASRPRLDGREVLLLSFTDITEVRGMQESLQRQAHLLDIAHDAILAWELDGSLVFWNRGAEELYGYAKDEALGRSVHRLLGTEFPAGGLEAVLAALQDRGQWRGEVVQTTAAGRRLVLASRMVRVQEPDRVVVLEDNRDITRRKQAEQARDRALAEARQQADHFRAIFESGLVGASLSLLENGLFLDCNDAFLALTGYARHEVVDHSSLELNLWAVPSDRARFAEALSRGEAVEQAEVTFRRRDGTLCQLLISTRPIDRDGRRVILTQYVDITDRQRAERHLQELNRMLERHNAELDAERAHWRAAVEGIADEVWMADAQGQMSLVNLPAVTAMGLEAFQDKSVDEVLDDVEILDPDGQVRPAQQSPLLRSLRGEIVRGEEIMEHRRTGKRRYRQFSSAPMHDAAGAITGAIAVVRDITENRQAEQDRREAEMRADAVLRASPVAVYISRAESGLLVDTNDAFLSRFGYQRLDLLGRTLRESDIWANYAERQGMLDTLLGGAPAYVAEHRFRSQAGEMIDCLLSTALIELDGEPLIIAELMDISERKQEESWRSKRTDLLVALSAASRLADVRRIVVQEGRELAGAAASVLWQRSDDGGPMGIVEASGYPAALAARLTPIELPAAVSQCLRSGQPLFWPTWTDYAAAYPEAGRQAAVPEMPLGAVAVLPLLVEGRTIGAYALSFAGAHPFQERERDLLQQFAYHCAQALDRARLYQAEQQARAEAERARQRLELLAKAGAALLSSLDYPTVLQTIARLAVPQVADVCLVYAADEHGHLRQAAGAHRDPAQEPRVRELGRHFQVDVARPNQPIAQALRGGAALLLPEVPPTYAQDMTDDPAQQEQIRQLALRSLLLVPLLAHGQALGVIGLGRTGSSPQYGPEDAALAQDLAWHCARVVENVQLYQVAQEAIRVRDEFLSAAAHELRTPLTSIAGYVELLQPRLEASGTLSERDRRAIQIIARQTVQLSRLVHKLLDFSRMQEGRLKLEPAPLDLAALVRGTIDEVRMGRLNVTIEYHGPPALPLVGDSTRLEQVIQNLLHNAIKYSPEGGTVRVGLAAPDGLACLTVSDPGIGIPAEALPHIFERFYRAPNVDLRHISGTGIGLYVVQEIVRQHGGTVQVESQEGQGSTFTVCLPRGE